MASKEKVVKTLFDDEAECSDSDNEEEFIEQATRSDEDFLDDEGASTSISEYHRIDNSLKRKAVDVPTIPDIADSQEPVDEDKTDQPCDLKFEEDDSGCKTSIFYMSKNKLEQQSQECQALYHNYMDMYQTYDKYRERRPYTWRELKVKIMCHRNKAHIHFSMNGVLCI